MIDPQSTKVIFIGVSKYTDEELTSLGHLPKTNVEKLKELLQDESILGVPENNCILFENEENHEIIKGINQFIREGESFDVLILYFVGHGAIESEEYYMLTNNTVLDNISSTAISWEKDIKKITEKSGESIQQRLYILDSCFSGEPKLTTSPYEINEHIESMNLNKGAVILSADSGKTPFNTEENHTYYTKALIEVLSEGVQDTEKEKINAFTLSNCVKKKLNTNPHKTNPDIKTKGDVDSIYFFKNVKFDKDLFAREEIEKKINTAKDVILKGVDLESVKTILEKAQEGLKGLSNKGNLEKKISELLIVSENLPLIKNFYDEYASSIYPWEIQREVAEPEIPQTEPYMGVDILFKVKRFFKRIIDWLLKIGVWSIRSRAIITGGLLICFLFIMKMYIDYITSTPKSLSCWAYDGKYKYKCLPFEQIEKDWVVDNLKDEQVEGVSFCYDSQTYNCDKFGRLYSLSQAEEVCVNLDEGEWQLPTEMDWIDLINSFGGGYYDNLENKEYDSEIIEKTYKEMLDSTAFSIEKKSGQKAIDGSYLNIDKAVYYWTTSIDPKSGKPIVFKFSIDNPHIVRDTLSKEAAISCRCVRNRKEI